MAIVLVEIPTTLACLDEDRFPDRDESHIFDHLLHYCSKFTPLPVITVIVEGRSATVVRGHKYLRIARALGHSTLRAVVDSPPSTPSDVADFLARPDVVELNWPELEAAERAQSTVRAWHVFFFERPLTADEKRDFEGRVANLFSPFSDGEPLVICFDDRRQLAEIEGPTPEGHEWARQHLATFAAFSQQRVRIVSFQGLRFPGSV